MSMSLYVLVSTLPNHASWQAGISRLNLNVELDPDLQVHADTGFSPCVVAGQAAGFELYVDSVSELIGDFPMLAEYAADRPHALSLAWGSSMADCACALAAAAGLARGCGGMVYSSDEDVICTVDELVQQAAEAVASL